jgi:hypothetical protein
LYDFEVVELLLFLFVNFWFLFFLLFRHLLYPSCWLSAVNDEPCLALAAFMQPGYTLFAAVQLISKTIWASTKPVFGACVDNYREFLSCS